jgi:tetratricopeptide (TPR) repeat protein
MSATLFYKSLTTLALALASYWSCRLALADWLFRANTPASVAKAAALDPHNASYHAWLAEIQEHDGRDPTAELETAASLNPTDSAVRIRLGLRAESEHDFARAEKYLIEAAQIDKLFAPRWTLANYYVRIGDADRFWPWARQALEMGYGDLTPLFQLCWRVSKQPHILPRQHSVLGQYLSFLLAQDHTEAAGPVADSFIDQADRSDTSILLNYCDRLIDRQSIVPAVTIWNKLCARKLIPYPPLDPDRGLALTNGNFQSVPMQQAFDWRTTPDPEISITRAQSPPELHFHLSGKQPEHCELLSQFLPLAAGKRYTFRFEYKTRITGLRWNCGTCFSLFVTDDWKPAQVTLTSPGRLALLYDRLPGSTRAEGEICLRNTSIALAPREP